MKTFTIHCDHPVSFRDAVTVEAEDVVAACRAAVDPAADRTHHKALDDDGAVFVTAVAEAADPGPWRTAPDAREISVLPVPRLFSDIATLAGYAATRSEDLVDQLCICSMPSAPMGDCGSISKRWYVCAKWGKAILDDIDRFGWGSAQSAAASVVGKLPEVT